MTTAYVTHPRYPEHNLPGHPEHAGRIRSVWQKLDEAGLTQRMKAIEAEPIDPELILSVHTERYFEALQWISSQKQIVHIDADTYALPGSFEIACLSAGGVVQAVREVLSGSADNAIAAVRPPGHHAIAPRGMGFCILGNVAIAARCAQRRFGIKRVMIVDYDVHHGNGTQDMFYDDDSVMFLSTHQYPFYPGTGAISETGTSKGRGYTVNIPLPAGHGDKSFATIYEQVVWQVARRFKPELILVSAGFDAHWSDPLASMLLSLRGYAHITRELIRMAETLCDGKIVFVMEGGYDLEVLGHGIRNIAHALLGDEEVSDPLGHSPRAESDVTALVTQVQQMHGL
jgi:acetoin utilization deacetylase AcuC-like enzyme